jgi:hypothetical protein
VEGVYNILYQVVLLSSYMNVRDTLVIMTYLKLLTSFDLYHYDNVVGDDSAFGNKVRRTA